MTSDDESPTQGRRDESRERKHRCHLCGRAVANPPTVTPEPYTICERARCKPERKLLEVQTQRIRRYWTPVYKRFLEKANGDANAR